MVRELPSLRLLCLRSVGAPACSPEQTFAPSKKTGAPSAASRLLRSFQHHHHHQQQQPTGTDESTKGSADDADRDNEDGDTNKSRPFPVSVSRSPCIGKDTLRRSNANEVDLNHPFIASEDMVPEYGNPALDCLQSYIDALVELSRFDDTRLSVHFWNEWKVNVILGGGGAVSDAGDGQDTTVQSKSNTAAPGTKEEGTSKKRKRNSSSFSSQRQRASKQQARRDSQPNTPLAPTPAVVTALGPLSLHNSNAGEKTIEAMVKSGAARYVGVLDLTGMSTLTDEMLQKLVEASGRNLRRLSIKNCRRLTEASIGLIGKYTPSLTCLDCGGSYNIASEDVLETLPQLPDLDELYASGLGWTDETLMQLVEDRTWRGLGVGFSMALTAGGIRRSLSSQTALRRLSLAFCEQAVDSNLLGFLGRTLTNLAALDIRGNQHIASMTSWYDGRVTAVVPGTTTSTMDGAEQEEDSGDDSGKEEQEQHNKDEVQSHEGPSELAPGLFVLARYTGIGNMSSEETKRIHPIEAAKLVCVLDGKGNGQGIQRPTSTTLATTALVMN